MPRRRNLTIIESVRALEERLTRALGTPHEKAIHLLLVARKNPETTTDELAKEVGLTPRTASRIFALYRSNGLNGLMQRLPRTSRTEAKSQDSRTTEHDEDESPAGETEAVSEGMLARIMEFVAKTPMTIDVREWLVGMRSALLEILPDVDYVVISKVTDVDLFNPTTSPDDVYFRESITESTPTTARKAIQEKAKIRSTRDGAGWKKILADGINEGQIDSSKYQVPEGRDYFYRFNGGTTFIGSILLFRKAGKPPISSETMRLLDTIEPLIVRLMGEAAARYQVRYPDEKNFVQSFSIVDDQRILTNQERKILIGHATGHSAREIARILHIAEETVKTHTQSILQKTGKKSIKELMGSLVSPRQSFDSDQT